jgi:hypothetical protein
MGSAGGFAGAVSGGGGISATGGTPSKYASVAAGITPQSTQVSPKNLLNAPDSQPPAIALPTPEKNEPPIVSNGNSSKKSAGVAGSGEGADVGSAKKGKKANGAAKVEQIGADENEGAGNVGKKEAGVSDLHDLGSAVNGNANGNAALHEKLSKAKNDAGKAGRVTAAVNAVAAKAAANQTTEAKDGSVKVGAGEHKSEARSPKETAIATEPASPPKPSMATLKKIDPATQPASASAFNGLGKCAVFPVPVSSLTGSVWATVLNSSSSELDFDPFGKLVLPISELLDLTLPPVDGVCLTPWPKAPGYYRRGVGLDGSTHAPAKQHAPRYIQTPGGTAPAGQGGPNAGGLGGPNASSLGGVGVGSTQVLQYEQQLAMQQQAIQRHQQAIAQGQGAGGGIGGLGIPSQGVGGGRVPPGGQNANTIPNIAALQQMFPGVKMSVGAPGQQGQGAKNA